MVSTRIAVVSAAIATLAALWAAPTAAHGYRVGDVRIQHPFATPTPPGATQGAAYFVHIENRSKESDRLVRATTAIAERVEFHATEVDAAQVARMRALDAVELPAGSTLQMKPGTGTHLMLIGLKQPLKAGQSFRITLHFERAGQVEVRVDVQQPRAGSQEHRH